MGDQRYLRMDSIVIAIVDSLISDSLEITDNDKQKIDTFYLDGMDSLKIKIENNTRIWSVYLGDLFSASGSDKQRLDTAVVIGNILYLSLQRDSVPAVQITLPTFTDTDTDSQSLYIPHMDSIGIYRGNKIYIRENQYPDTFTIVGHILRLSIKDDGMPYYSVDLSPYVNVTQVYAHAGTTTYQNTLSGGGGSFLLQASGATTIAHNGTGTVTISSTDTDNYIDSLFFTDGTDTLRIGRTGALPDLKVHIPDEYVDTAYVSNDTLVVGRRILGDIKIKMPDNDNYADSVTWDKTKRILYISRNGMPTLSDTLDGIDTQRVIIFRRNLDTVFIQITNDTTRYFLLPAAGVDTQKINIFSLSNDTLRIRIDNDTTRFVKLSDTDHQYFDTAYILNDTLFLSIIRDLNPVYKFNLKPYVNVSYTWGLNATNDAWGATTVTNGTTMTLDGIGGIKTQTLSNGSTTMTIDGQRLQWNLAANTGTTRLIGDWASGAETVNIRGTGIVTTRTGFDGFGSDSLIISATEVDGSITNEIQLIDTFAIVNHILRNSLSQDGEAFKSVDLSPYMQTIDTFTLVGSTLRLSITGDNQAFKSVDLSGIGGGGPDTDDQYADTFEIVSNILRLSIDGDAMAYKSVNLSSYLDNTDGQVIDTFSIVSNIVRLSVSGDGQAFKSIDLNPYLDNTDNQTIDTFALVGNTIRLSASGDGQAYKSIDLTAYVAQTWSNSGTTSWTGTLSGGGGSTTMLTNPGISLSHSAGTVTWSVTDQTVTNEGIPGVGAGTANSAVITSNTSGSVGVTLQQGGIISITETTSTNGGTITISATETDGSITNEAQNWNNTGGTNTYTGTLGQANGAGGGSITIVGAGQTTVSLSAGTLTINTPVTTDNDNYVDAVSFNNGSRTLTIGRTGVLSDLTAVIPDNNTDAQSLSWQSITNIKAIQAITNGTPDTIHTSTTSGIVFSQMYQSLFIKAVDTAYNNEGILGVGAGSGTSSTIISNTMTSNAVTINVAGINTITESTSSNGGSITITGTEVDGLITNELEYLTWYIVSGDTLGFIRLHSTGNDTVSFYAGDGSGGGGGGTTYTFSHTGGTSLVSTLNPSAGSISITPGTQIEVTGTASGINGTAKIKTNFNGCQDCVGYFGGNAGYTNDSIQTDPLFKYYYDEGTPTLEVPTVTLRQTNAYSNPVALYIAANDDERVFTSGVDASGFNSGTFYHRVAAAGTISLPAGHTGPTTHYFINDGYAFNIARSGSETIDGGLNSQSFVSTDKLVIVTNDGSGKWYTNKTAAGGSSGNIGHYFVPGSPQSISTTTLTDITNSTTSTIPTGIYRVKAVIKANSWGNAEGYTLALAAASGTATILTGVWNVHDCVGTTITMDQETMGTGTINSGISCSSNAYIVGEFDINVTVAATLKLRLGVETNSRSANIWYGSLTLVKI
jgi:hypothetical protein